MVAVVSGLCVQGPGVGSLAKSLSRAVVVTIISVIIIIIIITIT